jgi:hypothetical protein
MKAVSIGRIVARISVSVAIATAAIVAAPALAGEKEMLLCLPGFPGTSSQAQPYVDRMLRHLEGELGWPADSMSGLYVPGEAEGAERLAQSSAGIALVGPSLFAAHHSQLKMKVIAKVEVSGQGSKTYSVVAAKDGPASVAELAGKKVSGAVVHDPRFAANVLLGGQVAPDAVTFVEESRPLRSLRGVARGKVDAAIVDGAVLHHMGELDFADELKVIHTAEPVPAPAVVVMGEGKQHAGALKSALVGLCQRPEGEQLCKTLTLTAIRSASNRDYRSLLARY